MRSRPWLVLVALLVIAGVLVTARGLQGQDPDWHSSRSDGPKGTSALLLYAAALGRPARTLQGSFDLPASATTLFVFNPFTGYSPAEASRLREWVAGGGTLVYADDSLDGELSQAFGIGKTSGIALSGGVPAAPYFPGVRAAGSGSAVTPFRAGPAQAVALRSATGAPLALIVTVGSGRVIALADPLLLCNGFIGDADNWRLAAALIEASPAVAIDEFHHDLGNVSGSGDWSRQPLGIGLLWAFVAVFVGIALRNRRFGPRVHPGVPGERSSAEHVSAVGRLLRRFGGRGMTAELAVAATRRSLIERTGISRDATPAQLVEVLARSSPELAAEWAAAERDAHLAAASGSDAALAGALGRLHALAYPSMSPTATIRG